MVTGAGSEEVAVEAMKRGATDYLVKGSITPEILCRAVGNAVQRVQMQRAIKKQRERLIEAERQRVMIQSVGAACHHLGQPATVIKTALEVVRKAETSEGNLAMLDECLKAADAIADILTRLSQVSEYRTEPYYSLGDDESERPDTEIIAI